MVDAAVDFLVSELVDKLVSECSQVPDFHKHKATLNKEIDLINGYLKDVDMVRVKGQRETLKNVTRQFKELLYDAENIVEDCELFLSQYRRKPECINFFSPCFLFTRCQLAKKMQEITLKISDYRIRMVPYLITLPKYMHVESNRPVRYPILLDDAEIVGLDDDVKKIKRWIMVSSLPLRVVGIVGMGGIGKTTLAQKICNDRSVREFFHPVLFVTVSQTIMFEELLKSVLRQVDATMDSLNMNDKDLIVAVRKELDGKRCLIVLDDVWGIDEGLWWDSLKSALPKNTGCPVIVTTRNKEVALRMGAHDTSIHYPKLLPNDHSWSIFAKIAFADRGGHCQDPEIQAIGKEIISKCGGLPLAIKVVGGVMLGKVDSVVEWKRIAEYMKEELASHKQGEEFFSVLQLSYDELPKHLKPCMLAFAAFPEDYDIRSYEVIHWWIGEGFVQEGKGGRTAYELGEEYLDELISRSLLLGVIKEVYERRYNTCRVHDMIREVIIKVAKEDSFMGLDDRGNPSCIDKSRRVGVVKGRDTDHLNETSSQFFRTVIGRCTSESEEGFAQEFASKLCQLKRLRVLDISFRRTKYSRDDVPTVKPWLRGIEQLPHLICLQMVMSGQETLPENIGKLQKLQILSLTDCPHLIKLPMQVTSLKKLTMLELNGCDSIEYFPAGLGKLSNLQSLLGFKPAASDVKDGCHISELKMLTQLRRLDVVINSVSQVGERWMEVLSELKQLNILLIRFGHNITAEIMRNVDYMISPLQHLQDLRLYQFPGEMTPAWLDPVTLPNLRFLHVHGGKISRISERFYGKRQAKVWKLEVLLLSYLEDLEADWSNIKEVMPLLKQLKVVNCGKLESVPSGGIWRKEDAMQENKSDQHKEESQPEVTAWVKKKEVMHKNPFEQGART